MTAYSDLQTASVTLDATLATLVTDAKSYLDKAAIYETSVRTGSRFEGNSAAADAVSSLRAALVFAIAADGTVNALRLAKALRLPIRTVGKTATTAFP